MNELEQVGAACGAGRHPDRWRRMDHRYGRLRRLLHDASDVAVEALAGLAAERTRRQSLRSNHARAKARLVVVLAVDRLHDRMRDVERGQIHQFERPKAKAGLVLQDAVDGREIGDAFTDDSQRLGTETAARMVDDKARRVVRAHCAVAHLHGVFGQTVANRRVGLEAGNDFDDFHQGHRVEEVEARQTLRMGQHRSDRCHRQRRCIGRQSCAGCHHRFQILEELLFDTEVLNDGLDHQVAIAQLLHRRHRMNPCDQGIACCFVELSFFVQFVPLGEKRVFSGLCSTRKIVQHQHLTPCLCRYLRNSPAHGAGADHADLGKVHSHLIISSVGNFRL